MAGELALQDFIGHTTVAEDVITAVQARKMSVTLNRDDPELQPGEAIPAGWHSIYFPRFPLSKDLQRDGMLSELPDGPGDPLPRRMYAGNKMTFHKPLRIGEKARKEMELMSVTPKEGRSGKLVFVTYALRVLGEDGIATSDEINMVFREDDTSGRPPPPGEPGPETASWKRTVTVDPVMLFRFSATTFNPHRIHYDHPYTTGTEGYPKLLVHGPFTAVLILELARENNPDATMTSFAMKARAPLFVDDPITFMGEPTEDGKACELWAVNHEGMLAMQAHVTFA